MKVAGRSSIVVMNEDGPALTRLAELLEGEGYAVETCADASRIHDTVRARMPDLVLLDRRDTELPSGRAHATLRLDSQTSGIPIVQCYSDSDAHAVAAARADAMGCSILIAPFETGELLDRVRELLAQPVGRAGSR